MIVGKKTKKKQPTDFQQQYVKLYKSSPATDHNMEVDW